MYPKKYYSLLTTWRCYNEYPKDYHILALVGVSPKLADYSKKSSDKSITSNRESNNGDQSYIWDLPPWILEEKKGGVGNKTKYGKEYL